MDDEKRLVRDLGPHSSILTLSRAVGIEQFTSKPIIHQSMPCSQAEWERQMRSAMKAVRPQEKE
jgi:hypothetical protein